MPSFTYRELDEDLMKKLDTALGIKNSFYEFNPGKALLPPAHALYAQKILDMEVRKDDVWLVSFPRTGSTWCQEIIWLICNNLDFKTAETTPQPKRAPLLESSSLLFQHKSLQNMLQDDSIKFIENMPSPRCIKSHLIWDLLPVQLDEVKPKIIYTLRNPKDTAVSFYHYSQLFHDMNMSFEDYCELILKDSNPCGGMLRHYLPFWKRRNEPNFLILKYEDMKKDTGACIRQIADHLEKKISDQDVENIKEFLTFNKMRDNRGCNYSDIIDVFKGPDYYKRSGKHFMRKGVVGDWKNYMSPELAQRFDRWTEENTRGTGLSFEDC